MYQLKLYITCFLTQLNTFLVYFSVLDGDFLDGLFASFADLSYLQRRGNIVAESADEFRQNFDIERAREALEGQDFNVMEFLERFIQRIEDEAITEFASTQLSSIQECVKNVIQVRKLQ